MSMLVSVVEEHNLDEIVPVTLLLVIERLTNFITENTAGIVAKKHNQNQQQLFISVNNL